MCYILNTYRIAQTKGEWKMATYTATTEWLATACEGRETLTVVYGRAAYKYTRVYLYAVTGNDRVIMATAIVPRSIKIAAHHSTLWTNDDVADSIARALRRELFATMAENLVDIEWSVTLHLGASVRFRTELLAIPGIHAPVPRTW